MKTGQLAAMLVALSDLAEGRRAEDLRRFAGVFGGRDETIAARIKGMGRATAHPAALKASLAVIRGGLELAGAAKQAAALGVALTLFTGSGDASPDAFITEITTPPPPKKKAAPKPAEPDRRLARELADELARSVLDEQMFDDALVVLRSAKRVNTPTLGAVANIFLGNDKRYSGRKGAIDDIVRRRDMDARDRARQKALSRIGV